MYLKKIELSGFKSFAKKDVLVFTSSISAIVGPNGSGKSNVAEAFRFVLGEQSMKSMRSRRGEDLIFNGSPNVSRANRASVKVTFDNTKHLLDVDYDEVIIERVVHRDGINQYAINGSTVRLRDIVELFAHANIGSSGHHIISQGEADRILNANIKERREMVEDALGLKVYQYKKQESEKKLFKTDENIAQVTSLRKEIAPHLRFLERQVEKIEKTFSLKEELKKLYSEYLKRESEYIKYQKSNIEHKKSGPAKQLADLEKDLDKAKKILVDSKESDSKSDEVVRLEEELETLRKEKDLFSRTLGRVEGQIAFEERQIAKEKEKAHSQEHHTVLFKDIDVLVGVIAERIDDVKHADDASQIKSALVWIKDTLKEFVSKHKSSKSDEDKSDEEELKKLQSEKKDLEEKLNSINEHEENAHKHYNVLKKEIESVKDESREAEREVFRIMTQQSGFRGELMSFQAQEERVRLEEEDFEREITEAGVFIGNKVVDFVNFEVVDKEGNKLKQEDIVKEPREKQQERRRLLEKIKIRLEEVSGGASDEILKEYKEVRDRDEFFERELDDLEKSAESLKGLIKDLEEKLDVQFKEGIGKINTEFQKFFALLFDGGAAKLSVVRQEKRRKITSELEEINKEEPEEIESQEGIEVSVNLPHKRIRGLEMLSGGERALTSIALIFAMSQVNPPPFIILDETDAALDEANSRKYGDMIENLAQSSQLILITHNRETMSRAGVLYGVTMGSDGVSKLLSVKLEEAVQVTK